MLEGGGDGGRRDPHRALGHRYKRQPLVRIGSSVDVSGLPMHQRPTALRRVFGCRPAHPSGQLARESIKRRGPLAQRHCRSRGACARAERLAGARKWDIIQGGVVRMALTVVGGAPIVPAELVANGMTQHGGEGDAAAEGLVQLP